MKTLARIDQAVARFEGWLAVCLLGLMVFLPFLQVILRSLFLYGHAVWANDLMGRFDWTEPFVRLLVLWVSFLGASLVTGENKHIRIDLLTHLIPIPWLPFRELLLSLGGTVVSALMVRASLFYVHTEMTFGGKIFLSLPVWVAQTILPIGFALIGFRFLLRGMDSGIRLFRGTAR